MTIQFTSVSQQFVHERLKQALVASEVPHSTSEESPIFHVRQGSAFCSVLVMPSQNESSAVVCVYAWVVKGATVSDPALQRFLLDANYRVDTGSFGVDADGDISFSHSFVGTSLDQAQLQVQLKDSLTSVRFIADEYDDIICERWGGRREFEPTADDAAPGDEAAGGDGSEKGPLVPSTTTAGDPHRFERVYAGPPESPPVVEQALLDLEIDELRSRAESGEVGAQLAFAQACRDGRGVEASEARATKWFKKAAAQGNLVGQFHHGLALLLGRGVEANWARAAELFRLGAEQGFARAQVYLGYCLRRGVGVDADPASAASWYTKAAQSETEAQMILGLLYLQGEGVAQDSSQARRWLGLATDQELDSHPAYVLALCHENGEGLPVNPGQAAYWMLQSAERGNPLAQCTLARYHQDGIGVPASHAEALAWLSKAAAGGHEPAMFHLAQALRTGNGVAVDQATSDSLMHEAANDGYAPAQYVVGKEMFDKDAPPYFQDLAIEWLRKAEAQGHEPAVAELVRLGYEPAVGDTPG